MNPNLKGKEAKERRVVAYKRERNENHVVAGRIRWWLMTKYPNGNEAYKAHEEELERNLKSLREGDKTKILATRRAKRMGIDVVPLPVNRNLAGTSTIGVRTNGASRAERDPSPTCTKSILTGAVRACPNHCHGVGSHTQLTGSDTKGRQQDVRLSSAP